MNSFINESKNLIKRDLKLEVLTPIHIGDGKDLGRLDYIMDPNEKKLLLLNQRQWLNFLIKNNLQDKYVELISQSNPQRIDLFKWLKDNHIPNITRKLQENDVVNRVISTRNKRIRGDFKGFIRDGNGELYIPGSTIKGAIVNAILTTIMVQLKQKNPGKFQSLWQQILSVIDGNPKAYNEELEKIINGFIKNIFGQQKNGKNELMDFNLSGPFRGIRVSDAYSDKKLETVLEQKTDIVHKYNKRGVTVNPLTLWRECLEVKSTLNFSITFDTTYLKANRIGNLANDDILISRLNSSYKFFKQAYELPLKKAILDQGKQGEIYIDNIKTYNTEAPLYLGGGPGFVEKTLIYALAPDDQQASYVVRKILQSKFDKYPKDNFAKRNPTALKVINEGQGDYVRMGLVALSYC